MAYNLTPHLYLLHGSDEGIKLLCTDGEVIGNILGNVDVIILGLDVGT